VGTGVVVTVVIIAVQHVAELHLPIRQTVLPAFEE